MMNENSQAYKIICSAKMKVFYGGVDSASISIKDLEKICVEVECEDRERAIEKIKMEVGS